MSKSRLIKLSQPDGWEGVLRGRGGYSRTGRHGGKKTREKKTRGKKTRGGKKKEQTVRGLYIGTCRAAASLGENGEKINKKKWDVSLYR